MIRKPYGIDGYPGRAERVSRIETTRLPMKKTLITFDRAASPFSPVKINANERRITQDTTPKRTSEIICRIKVEWDETRQPPRKSRHPGRREP